MTIVSLTGLSAQAKKIEAVGVKTISTSSMKNKYGYQQWMPDFSKPWTSGCILIDDTMLKRFKTCRLGVWRDGPLCTVKANEGAFVFAIYDSSEACKAALIRAEESGM